MGYSHYFETGTLVFDEPFLADVRAIVREADAMGIALSGDPAGSEPRPPEVGPEGIVINGLEALALEPLVLEPGGEAARGFCKTNRLPYDAVVGAILMRVAESRPDADIASDGSFLLDWKAARRLFAAALDREGPCPARVALATVRLDGSEPGDKAWGYLSVYPDGTAWCFGKAPMRRGGNEPSVDFGETFDLGSVADFASRHGLDVSGLGSLVASSVGRTTSELNDELLPVCMLEVKPPYRRPEAPSNALQHMAKTATRPAKALKTLIRTLRKLPFMFCSLERGLTGYALRTRASWPMCARSGGMASSVPIAGDLLGRPAAGAAVAVGHRRGPGLHGLVVALVFLCRVAIICVAAVILTLFPHLVTVGIEALL